MPQAAMNDRTRITEDNFSELLKLLPDGNSYQYIAFYTDKVTGGKADADGFNPLPVDPRHLLEIRIFNPDRELKAARLGMGREFRWRLADEAGLSDGDIYEESHYLDIDGTKDPIPADDGVNTIFHSTTGGAYALPVPFTKQSPPVKIKLVNYIRYDDYGNLQIVDYRIKGFIRGDGSYAVA